MNTPKRQAFDILEIDIRQDNLPYNQGNSSSKAKLIEASAGTGKTYSIGILALRLIIEQQIDIRQILMVTYTKAAVAELEGRIRLYVQQAYQYMLNAKNEVEPIIADIIARTSRKDGEQEVLKRLKTAYLNLDETAIFTIHSFCQKTLSEFAFETHQFFSSELIQSDKDLIEKAVNKYWRSLISTLSKERLAELTQYGLQKSHISDLVQNSLKQFEFIYPKNLTLEALFQQIDAKKEAIDLLYNHFLAEFQNSEERQQLRDKASSLSRYSVKAFAPLIDDAEAFLMTLIEKITTKYVQADFPVLAEKAERYSEATKALKDLYTQALSVLYGLAIEPCLEDIQHKKEQFNLLSFDDLILHLHRAVYGAHSDVLKYELQKKYRAVFIDEFQDTDRLQYDIFKALFEHSRLIFYIGDPKQAIYGFRGADIETYKKASNNISETYTMRKNFRSSLPLIEACNSFFNHTPDAFYDQAIQYETVSNGKDLEPLCNADQESPAFTLIELDKSELIPKQVAQEIFHLLSTHRIKGRKVIPSDIAVLVRTGKQAQQIKKELDKWNIPAITLNDEKLIETKEARDLLWILQAIAKPNAQNIKKALLSSFVSFSIEEVEQMPIEEGFKYFTQLKQQWEKYGVLSALQLFIKYFKVKDYLLNPDLSSGQRILANLYHLMEWVHQIEVKEHCLPEELCFNYAQQIALPDSNTSNDYIQRIESDEKAVQLVTIHKSKGLAYHIVICPYLNLKASFSSLKPFIVYKQEHSEQYSFSLMKTDEEKEYFSLFTEKENRRLMYVALTRAVYKNIVFSKKSKSTSDCLNLFVQNLPDACEIERRDAMDIPKQKYQIEEEEAEYLSVSFDAHIQQEWERNSFSKLNRVHSSMDEQECPTQFPDAYSQFIFKDIGKGAVLGNFVHELLENIDFVDADFEELILSIGKKYPKIFREKDMAYYQKFLHRILHCQLAPNLQLHNISQKDRITEMEFYFNTKSDTLQAVNTLSSVGKFEEPLLETGVMQGFIDLVFKHQEKFYILDWKTNHLGYSTDCYTQDHLEKAMQAHNYHLQYLIYTLALHRFLKQKLPNYDYERDFGGVYYLFVRACQDNENTGVYYVKPPLSLIERLDKPELN